MTRHKADVIIALDLVNISEQIGKIVNLTVVALCILAVAIDVLTEQRYILVSCFNQTLDLGDYILGSAASLATANVRNDTVRAEIIAAVHYRDPRAIIRLAVYRQAFCNEVLLFLGTVEPLALFHFRVYELGQSVQGRGSEHEINVRIAVLDILLAVLLRYHTSADTNKHIGLRRLKMLVLPDYRERLLLGMLSHRAGVDHNKIGKGGLGADLIAHR